MKRLNEDVIKPFEVLCPNAVFNFAASGQAEEHRTGFESYAVADSEETPQKGDSGDHFR